MIVARRPSCKACGRTAPFELAASPEARSIALSGRALERARGPRPDSVLDELVGVLLSARASACCAAEVAGLERARDSGCSWRRSRRRRGARPVEQDSRRETRLRSSRSVRSLERCRRETHAWNARRGGRVRALVHRLTSPWRRSRDLRDWIALLEREGELRRITAEVDPDLEITEIVDRVVKSGAARAALREPEGLQHPAAHQPVRHRAAHVPRVRRASTRRRGGKARRHPRHAAAARAFARRCKGLMKLKSIADSRPKIVSKAPCQEVVLRGRRRRHHAASDPDAAGRATRRRSSRCRR